MGCADAARADGDRAARCLTDPELAPRLACADDVGDRIERADLVEVNILGVDTVRAAFRLGEHAKDAQTEVDRAFGDCPSRTLEHVADRGPRAVRRVLDEQFDVNFEASLPAAVNGSFRELYGAGDDGIEHGLEALEVRSRVDQGSKQHVARDPCGCVDPCDRAGGGINVEVVAMSHGNRL